MSLFVIRHVALTFEDEARCAAFHKRIREMFIRHSSHTWTYDGTEEITLDTVGEDKVDWSDQLSYVFKGRNEEERLVRIWTMGIEGAKVKLSFKDMFEPDARTLLIFGEQACWGPELYSCFRQYLDGDFGLERVKVLLWCEDYSAEVWCQDSDGCYFYNKIDSDGFECKRQDVAEEQGIDLDEDSVDDVEVLETTGILYDGSDYSAYCDELDNLDMADYPVFYAAEGEAPAGESEESVQDAAAPESEASASNGEAAGQRFCEQCGAELQTGSAFCTQCGASIDDAPVRSDGEHTLYLPRWMRKSGRDK